MAPALARLARDFSDVQVIALTQRYGYVAGGRDARPEAETRHIEAVWRDVYGAPARVRLVIDEETFRNYGVSTTPTLVLVDAGGIVRSYHPGTLSWEELSAAVRALRTATPVKPARAAA
jgi:hypothetical protein